MKNTIVCSSCSCENPYYEYICKNCKSFLRDKVYNIDLWKLTGSLIESPSKAFKQIIFAEHKNYIFFIWIFVAAKLLVNTRFAASLSIGEFNTTTSLYLIYLLTLAIVAGYIVIFSVCTNILNKFLKFDTRFRDTIALITYSLLPNIAGIVFIFILELVVFGGFLFSINPTPFEIKGLIAYFFAGAEFLLVVWSVFLTFSAFKTQTNSRIYGTITTIVFYLVLSIITYITSTFIFIL